MIRQYLKSLKLRIVILAPHTMVADCLVQLLGRLEDVGVVKIVCDQAGLLDQSLRLRPHLCLFVGDPVSTCFDFVQTLREKNPDCAVGVISDRRDVKAVKHVLKWPIDGYLLQSEPVADLQNAVRQLGRGQKVLSSKLFVTGRDGDGGLRWDSLSVREIQVLRDFVCGLSAKDSAERLSINSKTVDTHRRRIKQKLGLDSPAEMMLVGFAEGLIELG